MRAVKLTLISLLFAFLPLPIIIVALSSITENGLFAFPVRGVSFKWYIEFLTNSEWLTLLLLSVAIAVLVAVISTFLAFLASLVIARGRFKGASAFESFILLPLVFPHAALGVVFMGLLGLLGCYGTYAGIILAHCILTLPFAYRPILNSMKKLNPAMEEASMSLGARPLTVLRTVTLPLLRPGLITSLLFSFIVSFDEVTVTVFLISPDVMTLPVKILTQIQESGSPVIAAISTFLVCSTLVIVLVLEKTVGLELFVEVDRAR